MPRPARKRAARRQPTQRRAQQTVDAILDAVTRVLKRDGVEAVTTNRIAEVAGVSIGSVYQYFPDKRAIFLALHDRHVNQINRLVGNQVVEHATAPLQDLVRALVGALVDAHAIDPDLHELLVNEAPHRSEGARGSETHLRGALRLAISSRADELGAERDLERTLFVVTHMIDSLAHGAVLRRSPRLSLAAAKDEAVKAVLAYLQA